MKIEILLAEYIELLTPLSRYNEYGVINAQQATAIRSVVGWEAICHLESIDGEKTLRVYRLAHWLASVERRANLELASQVSRLEANIDQEKLVNRQVTISKILTLIENKLPAFFSKHGVKGLTPIVELFIDGEFPKLGEKLGINPDLTIKV